MVEANEPQIGSGIWFSQDKILVPGFEDEMPQDDQDEADDEAMFLKEFDNDDDDVQMEQIEQIEEEKKGEEEEEEKFQPMNDQAITKLMDQLLPRQLTGHYLKRDMIEQLIREVRPEQDTSLITDHDRVLKRSQAVDGVDLIFVCAECDNIVNDPVSCNMCESLFCRQCALQFSRDDCRVCQNDFTGQ